MSDIYNDAGLFEDRRIAINVRGLNEDEYYAHAGTLFPSKLLDHKSDSMAAAAAYIDMARWALQNTAVRATVVVPYDSRLIPNTVVHIDDSIVDYPTWRIVSARHTFDDTKGNFTQLNLALWQGHWKRYTASSFRPATPSNFFHAIEDDKLIISWQRGRLQDPVYTGEWDVLIVGTKGADRYTLTNVTGSLSRYEFEIQPADSTEDLEEGIARRGFTYHIAVTARDLYGKTSNQLRETINI